jgi:hypothetical protein
MTPDATQSSPRLWKQLCGFEGTPTDRRNMRLVNICAVVWVLVFLVSLKLMETYGDDSLTISAAALIAAALAWVPLVWAYLRYLREADELLRMIHVQAMAVAFSAGFCVVLLDRFLGRVASLMPQSAVALKLVEVAYPMVMVVAFTVTVVVLQRRYSR